MKVRSFLSLHIKHDHTMHKNILIPTDFTIRSLGLLKIALSENHESKINVILSSGIHMSSSISELLFYSKSKLIKTLVSSEFEEALQVIESKYSSHVNNITIEPFTGATQNAFQNFLKGNRISETYVYTGYKPRFNHASAFDLSSYIIKASATHKVPYEGYESEIEHRETFADLFFSKIPGLNR